MKVFYEEGNSKKGKYRGVSYGIVVVFVVVVFPILIVCLKDGAQQFGRVEAQRLESGSLNQTGVINQVITREQGNVDDFNDVTKMLDAATKSVVGVSKLKDNGGSVFFNNGVDKIGIGSGIIVSDKGYILTNEHVSGSKGGTCYITLEDGKQYVANVVWSDSNLDLAFLKANMKFIDFCALGDSDAVSVGQIVYAIGNPIGFEFQKTVTSGIISAVDRTVVFKEDEEDIYLSNLIQTDAIINPGNSGGPLINTRGEVIGINTVKITSADGIGFAVPVNCVRPILERFENEGKFEEAGIGIFAYDKNVISYINTGLKFDTGIYVAQISLNSPAYRSGLQIGDIIVKIDDIQLEKMCDLREYIYEKRIGDRVKLVILRNNKTIELEVELTRK